MPSFSHRVAIVVRRTSANPTKITPHANDRRQVRVSARSWLGSMGIYMKLRRNESGHRQTRSAPGTEDRPESWHGGLGVGIGCCPRCSNGASSSSKICSLNVVISTTADRMMIEGDQLWRLEPFGPQDPLDLRGPAFETALTATFSHC